MADDPVPDVLCSICQTNVHKYKCPACPLVKTCSLQCHKQHRSRASCANKSATSAAVTRYRKKSELIASEEAFDQDYNFLTRIERDVRFPKASVDIGGDARPSKRQKSGPRRMFEEYLMKNDIKVKRAPEGMSRAKENKSRFLPRSNVAVWTVEWIITELDTKIEQETFNHTKYEIHNAQKEVADVQQKSMGFNSVISGDVKADMTVFNAASVVFNKDKVKKRKSSTAMIEIVSNNAKPKNQGDIIDSTLHSEVTSSCPELNGTSDIVNGPDRCALYESKDMTVTTDSISFISDPDASHPVERSQVDGIKDNEYYYLLRPFTVGTKKVLIFIMNVEEISISQVLKGQTVLEFPTIYILPFSPVDLKQSDLRSAQDKYLSEIKERFMLEPDYNDKVTTEENTAMNNDNVPLNAGFDDVSIPKTNERRILEMLRRDVTSNK